MDLIPLLTSRGGKGRLYFAGVRLVILNESETWLWKNSI